MVYIKRVQLSHFKSFGGTTSVPLLPGFTVISGPNGSGKSNILDALLFCLGLSSSKGMRAERLPDLVNHKQSNNKRTVETSVSVTFDISDIGDLDFSGNDLEDPATPNGNGNGNGNGHHHGNGNGNGNGHHHENGNDRHQENGKAHREADLLPQIASYKDLQSSEWTVTRRLRVTKGGNYSSTYYINGELCTATELHEQLNRLRIYPEGYNVVLQGDVTRIITMNSRERREIIDELAGVAEFDRKINRTKQTLEAVKEREDRCRIIEQELIKARDRLAADRIKAEKYQKLKATIQEKKQWEVVLIWRSLQQQHQQIQTQISASEKEATQLREQLNTLDTQIGESTTELDRLNTRVKALGEDEQLSVASQLATQKAKRHQLEQKQQELETTLSQTQASLQRTEDSIEQHQQSLVQVTQEKAKLETQTIPRLSETTTRARENLTTSREKANAIAATSEATLQEQTALSHQISHQQKTLNPLRTEQAQLTERKEQLTYKIEEQTQNLATTETELTAKQTDAGYISEQATTSEQQIHTLAQKLVTAEDELTIEQQTQKRLLEEQRKKQRQLDKLEAANQAQQEAQGTYASKLIFQANLPGVCGLVAQLGQVETRYQLALETAAGGRLGFLVVEDDGVAAAGIQLLKENKAGRLTFLPLNKIKSPRIQEAVALRYARGFIDLALNLIDYQPRYQKIFAHVFGSTVVFETLNDARPYLGQHRIVTLEGEILESSGAMTGGSRSSRSTLHFGTSAFGESEEIKSLRRRLAEIEYILLNIERSLSDKSQLVNQLKQKLTEARQEKREQQLRLEQFQREIKRLTTEKDQLTSQLSQNRQELETSNNRLQILAIEIPKIETELNKYQEALAALEETSNNSEWKEIQSLIKTQEAELEEKEKSLRLAEEECKDLENKYQRLEEKITESKQKIAEYKEQKEEVSQRRLEVETELLEIAKQIEETEKLLQELSEKLGEAKKERDRAEETLKKLQNKQQKKTWQLQKLEETQQERQQQLETLQQQLEAQEAELPDPLPEIPQLVASPNETGETGAITFDNFTEQLEQLQKEIRNSQKRLEAMEPVNMLALEEHEKTQNRLQELTDKLSTLEAERTELLLRIENFTTLRFRAFKEAYDAVDENFQGIFATLSEGDGHLQLDDAEDPFNGGLNLVAHPKGKPVQRLSSMSGGEKSLTALSFIFALQKYRPSPFYAFDEVDMFLDGANVERLSKMIKMQAQQAQFIVVSLRRPMIAASERTIGVTQARGAHTQVLGIKL